MSEEKYNWFNAGSVGKYLHRILTIGKYILLLQKQKSKSLFNIASFQQEAETSISTIFAVNCNDMKTL